MFTSPQQSSSFLISRVSEHLGPDLHPPTPCDQNQGIDDGMADEWLSITTRKAVGPGACELPPSTRKTVEARALEWVRRNRGMLPRLALPVPQQPAGGVASVAKTRA